MDLRFVGFSLGLMLTAISLFMLVPALVDLRHGNEENAWAFLECSIAGFFTGSLLSIINSNFKKDIGLRESFLMTTSCWLVASFLASLPLHFSDLNLSYADSFFESVSGITTTGSTVLSGLDKMSPGILLWRSLIQWIGGMGVIGLAIVFLPFLRIGGMQLFQSESSDKSEKSLPRTGHVVSGIFVVYCILTILCGFTYYALGMTGFDALNHALTTLPTGGYSTHDASMGAFNPAIQWAASLYMILAGLPFILFLRLFLKKDTALFTDSQTRACLAIIGAASLVLCFWLWTHGKFGFFEALRLSIFNVASVISTTGYATSDYLLWGQFPIIVFLFLTYLGACSGSTTGGIKTMRLQIVALHGATQIKKLFYPNAVFSISYQGKPLTPAVVQSVMVFLFIYVIANVFMTIALAMTGLDFTTALSGAATAIANVGPGIGNIIGPAGNFSSLPDTAKLILCFGMILGRLELMTVLVLFHPSFWKP